VQTQDIKQEEAKDDESLSMIVGTYSAKQKPALAKRGGLVNAS